MQWYRDEYYLLLNSYNLMCRTSRKSPAEYKQRTKIRCGFDPLRIRMNLHRHIMFLCTMHITCTHIEEFPLVVVSIAKLSTKLGENKMSRQVHLGFL